MKTNRKAFLLFLAMVVSGLGVFSYFTYTIDSLNRYFPFAKTQTGYTILPKEVTYNGGHAYEVNDQVRQIPDPYEDMPVINTETGAIDVLTFQGGQSPEGKNYVKVTYKLNYVYEITFISWDSVPANIQKLLSRTS